MSAMHHDNIFKWILLAGWFFNVSCSLLSCQRYLTCHFILKSRELESSLRVHGREERLRGDSCYISGFALAEQFRIVHINRFLG